VLKIRKVLEKNLLEGLREIVFEAGQAILEIYKTDFSVDIKEDQSPLTQADLAAHEIIVSGLTRLTPGTPILSEESVLPDYRVRKKWKEYWLVDPLDGTKEFVNRNGEFTVNVALICDHQPVIGVVGVPVQGKIFLGDVEEGVAELHTENEVSSLQGRTFDKKLNKLSVVASRSHGGEELDAFLKGLKKDFPLMTKTSVGSSLKLCILASGEADFYPRIGPTNEWDIAAAHAVVRASGGELFEMNGEAKKYNTQESLLNENFYAVSDLSFDWRKILDRISH
jgi:3'(2'), 5'-bisphosphate nucleotidase